VVTVVTLGPRGTCHERPAAECMVFQAIAAAPAPTTWASPTLSTSPPTPDDLRLVEETVEIDPTWIVYGTN
jgi:hypothetical protein